MRYATANVPPERVAPYLPANYSVRPESDGRTVSSVIYGEDRAGWTLDGYVIPRLASGLIFATERTTS